MKPPEESIESAVRTFAKLVASYVADELRAGDQPGWVDQSASELRPRAHCKLARRLIAEGKGDATRVGRRWLIRRERLDRELGIRREQPTERDERLAESLGLKLVAGGRK